MPDQLIYGGSGRSRGGGLLLRALLLTRGPLKICTADIMSGPWYLCRQGAIVSGSATSIVVINCDTRDGTAVMF